ncbi:hypothetical protein LCGC14_2344600, partial [marine sediment metagenome]
PKLHALHDRPEAHVGGQCVRFGRHQAHERQALRAGRPAASLELHGADQAVAELRIPPLDQEGQIVHRHWNAQGNDNLPPDEVHLNKIPKDIAALLIEKLEKKKEKLNAGA